MRILFFLLVGINSFNTLSAQEIFYKCLADSALELTKVNVRYNPAYRKITYPGGDVPMHEGVCSDVIIRAYKKTGIDLQKEVHLDMKANFSLYPKLWKMKSTDRNIDHRRVLNLMKFFERKGRELFISQDAKDYNPGDIVCWNLGGAITHIGIVSSVRTSDNLRYKIIHNIGQGQVLEDCLFKYKIIGHYQYSKV